MPNSLFGLEARLEGSFAHFGSRSLVNVTSQLRREFGTHGRRSSHRSLQLPVALQAARATRGLHVTEGAPSVATNNETPLSSSGLFCPRALYPLWRINHRTFFFFFFLSPSQFALPARRLIDLRSGANPAALPHPNCRTATIGCRVARPAAAACTHSRSHLATPDTTRSPLLISSAPCIVITQSRCFLLFSFLYQPAFPPSPSCRTRRASTTCRRTSTRGR